MFSEMSILCNRPSCHLWAAADPLNDTIKVDSSRFDKDHHLHNVQLFKDDYSLANSSTRTTTSLYKDFNSKQVAVCRENSYSESGCKENSPPLPLEVAAFQAAMKERQEQEEMRQKALEEASFYREEARRLERIRKEQERQEAETLAEERRDRERRKAEVEAEGARRLTEENLQRLCEAERNREEREKEAAREEEEREKHALFLQDKETLENFLTSRGYSSVNSKRTKMLKSKYPLHSAVKDHSLKLVELLLSTGADPTSKNSAGLSPAHLAMKLNVQGSYDDIIRALQRIRNPE